MRTVGIRELKIHISKYLKNVKEGGELLVSERGKTIAMIVPISKPRPEQVKLHSILVRLSDEGKIMMPAAYTKPSRPLSRKKVTGTPFSDAIKEARR